MARHKVLLVEDNDELRRLYKDIFRHNNFEVFEAVDGEQAIDEALNSKPDVIILDLMLPRQGGLRALKIYRSLPECKHTPVIILTAMPNPDYQREAAEMVQGYYLKTAIGPQELVGKVRDLLEGK
ncbi:MAG: response regulator [Candidatus Berkelbacteria bacterium]|nr:MAG: response regulator [Candidatus Berkelbacteria bacterium]QQG51607.1 MAG: response regulator [Candidatus Berkelbacteria bacterium]